MSNLRDCELPELGPGFRVNKKGAITHNGFTWAANGEYDGAILTLIEQLREAHGKFDALVKALRESYIQDYDLTLILEEHAGGRG